jgi:hypothetical protein
MLNTLRAILLDCVGVEINLSKSSLNVLQAATKANPRTQMRLVYEQCPILAELPQVTEGFFCLGTPIGPLPFMKQIMAERRTVRNDEFQNVFCYPYPHDFLQIVHYCCNLKIVHLLRHLGPRISDSAQRFDVIIDQFTVESPMTITTSQTPLSSQHSCKPSFPSQSTTIHFTT